jgi:hypothetical protein
MDATAIATALSTASATILSLGLAFVGLVGLGPQSDRPWGASDVLLLPVLPAVILLQELHALLHERFDIEHTTIRPESEALVQIVRPNRSALSSNPQGSADHGDAQKKEDP